MVAEFDPNSAIMEVAHYRSSDQLQGLLYPPADLQLLSRGNAPAKIENVGAVRIGCGDGHTASAR